MRVAAISDIHGASYLLLNRLLYAKVRKKT